MNIRYLVRDRSFLTFLVGGLILVGLTSAGIYLSKNNFKAIGNQVAIVQDDNQTDKQNQNDTNHNQSNSGDISQTKTGQVPVSNGGAVQTSNPSAEANKTSSSGLTNGSIPNDLPRTGPKNGLIDLIALGLTTYGVVAFVQLLVKSRSS